MSDIRKNAAGFTLIELMVVVAILVVLIGILIPAIGSSRDNAREGATRAQLTHIATACESYNADYGAYPGVIDDKQFTSSSTFSGSQNLYLTLTRRFYPGGMALPTGALATTVTVGTQTVQFDQDPSKPTANYSTAFGPLVQGTAPNLYSVRDSYYPAAQKEISNQSVQNYVKTGMSVPSATALDAAGGLPCLMDYSFAFAQMPILYYRTNYKYNSEYDTAKGGTNRPGFATDVVGLDGSTPATGRFVYYAATEMPLVPSMDVATLQKLIGAAPPPGGGFVLIAADRHRTPAGYTIVQKSN